jgi:hypothetical protein
MDHQGAEKRRRHSLFVLVSVSLLFAPNGRIHNLAQIVLAICLVMLRPRLRPIFGHDFAGPIGFFERPSG